MQQTHRISPFHRVAGFLALSCLAASGVWAQTPIRIDCGGASSTFTGADGQQWLTDRYFTSSDTRYTGSPIANTADQYLYRTARAGLYSDFQYNIPVTNGSYNLTLKFAEIQYNARGQRVFNVTVNGVKVLNNFDIMAEVPKVTALDKTFPVTVTNGNINIQFTGVVGRGIINAIKVEPSATTSTATSTATGPYYAEAGGLVSLEAEHGKIINRSGKQWIPSTNSWDYSGGGFLLPSPTSGTVFDPNYVGVAPEVQFQVNFQTIGTYAIWLRGAGTNVNVGLDGAAVAGGYDIANFNANWGWSHTRMDGSFATLTITSAGVHTVNIWMRDDAFWFDKLVLAQTSGYAPSGTGPAESASSTTAPTTSTTTTPPPTTTPSGPYYSEAGGVVSLEAEDGTIVNRSGKQWTASTNSWNYSGNGFLLPSPTTGTIFDPTYVGVAPEVQFQVNFQTTGTYAVWVRGAGTNVHAGLDGVAVATASDIGNFTADWGWSHTRMDGSFATLTVAAAGVHTVNVWMRDDAFWFDKIVLTQGSAPSGTGPAESAYVSGTSSTPAPAPAPAPAPNPVASSRPPYGVVHPPSNGCNSTIASAGFVQNWWDQGGSVSSLQSAVSAENNCGKMEVPLFFTSPNWNATQSQIASAMTSYFKGNPSIPYWQFGWEENIHGRCCSSTDLSTLYSELSGVAAARSAAGVSQAQIAYQMVFGMGNPYNSTTVDLNSGGTLVQFQALMNSPAASLIDTLAIHPYAWNNYPTPETWEDQMLSQVRGYIAASPYAKKDMQIIYTEAGAPVCDSSPTGCTLSEFGTPVRGQGQQENAEYMVKLHVIGFNAGVRNIVWYQQGFSPDPYCTTGSSGESCFGMSNSIGPRLVASAYRTMTECMTGKSATPKFTTVNGNVRVYEFPSLDGSSASCIVAWTYQNGVTEVVQPRNPAVSIALSSITGKTVTSVQNTTGASIGFTAGGSLNLSPAPVFIQAQ